jgi:hypothetical protein
MLEHWEEHTNSEPQNSSVNINGRAEDDRDVLEVDGRKF